MIAMIKVVAIVVTPIVHDTDANDHHNEHVFLCDSPDNENDDDDDDDDEEEEEEEEERTRRISSVGSDTIPGYQVPKQPRPSAAVIGSGMSGLIAAHLLEETHEVGNDVGLDALQVNQRRLVPGGDL